MNNKVKFLRGTSSEYAVAEKDSDTIYFTTDDGKLYIGDKEVSGSDITIDDTLSNTSENPVQNKVVKQAIDNKADKTVATTSADGLMSAEDKSKLDSVGDTYALKSKYGDTTINVGRKPDTTIGEYSTAEGFSTTASASYSHTEGHNTTASGVASHAEGIHTTASGEMSHAEGQDTTASGANSHAEGFDTIADGLSSHAGGTGTKALHDNEVSYGIYNLSNDNTLFSVGDGTSDTARHNAIEITTTGGKLHDKDIATTDLIPTTLPANGGNADYAKNADKLDGLHALDFVRAFNGSEMGNNRILIPNDVHVGDWLAANAEVGIQYYRHSGCSGQTGLPDVDTSWTWFLYDGLTYMAKTVYNRFFFMDYINSYNGWIEIYTSNSKPYVTGTVSGWEVASSGTAPIEYTVLDFTPSFVIYVFDNGITDFATPITNGFRIVINSSSGTSAKYFAFK